MALDPSGKRSERLSVTLVSGSHGSEESEPDALLTRNHSLTGWADAIVAAGADAVTVVQRYRRDAVVRRRGVDYHFVADDVRAPRYAWLVGRRMTRTIRGLRPTIVHVNGLVFPLLVRRLRWGVGNRTAIVVQDHGGFFARSASFQSWQGRALYRFGLRAADGFLFTARDQADPWLRAGIIGREQAIHEIPEASTDLASWPSALDGQSPLPGRPALLWVGRLESNKDPLTVLAGFERAAASLPQAELTLVYGEEPLLAEVQSRIAASAVLKSRVHLRGKVERGALPALYAGADLFVLGSHREVACFSLLEAMSFGVTPVVTDIPPFRTLTDCGRMGALFPPGDANAFARSIERVGRDDFAARRRSVLEHFERALSWPVVGHRALEVYRATAARRGASLDT